MSASSDKVWRILRQVPADIKRVIRDARLFLRALRTHDTVDLALGSLAAESALAQRGRTNRYAVTISSVRRDPQDVTLTVDIYAADPGALPAGHHAYFAKRLRARPMASTRVEVEYDWETTAGFSVDSAAASPDEFWRGPFDSPTHYSVCAILRDSRGSVVDRLTVYQELVP
jgi:hypothetical protein